MAVDEKQFSQDRDQQRQEIPARADSLIGVHHPVERALLELQQQWRDGPGIEQERRQKPVDPAVDKGAEEQIHLAVEYDQQLDRRKLCQRRPEPGPGNQDDDGVGHEHGQPQEVVAADMFRHQEALDGRIARDGLQNIGLHHHAGRGLDDKPQQVVDGQDDAHRGSHHAGLAVGSHSDEGPVHDQIDGEENAAKVNQALGPPVLLECGATLVAKVGVLAQQSV